MTDTEGPRLAIVGSGAVLELAIMPALHRIGWRPSVLVDSSLQPVVARKLGRTVARAKRSADWRAVAEEFDAAIVVLPPLLQSNIATALLAAGKHVLLEKPLPSFSEENLMSQAAARGNVTFSISLPRRYLPTSQWTKALLESGVLGAIKQIDVREGAISSSETKAGLQLQPDLANGGSMRNVGADTLDLVLWWFDDIELLNYRDDNEGGTEAERVLDFRLASGARAHIEFSRSRRMPDSARIEGERGFVEVHLFKNQVMAGSANALSFSSADIRAYDMKPRFVVELFEAELREYWKRICTDEQARQAGRRSGRVSEVIERCYAVREPLVYAWAKPVLKTSTVLGANNSVLPPNSKVLVTGATGFIGGRLVERLLKEHGASIRCSIRGSGREARLGRLPVELVRVDLSNAEQIDQLIDGVQYVFHCAHDGQSLRQNIDGLRNIITASAAHAIRRLIYVSTFAVYEPFLDGPLTEETRDGDRSNAYVDIKLDMEKMVFDAVREKGLAATIIQPSIVYGPFCWPWTNIPAEMLLFGEVVLPDRGEGLCNAVYIDDLVDAMTLASVAPAAVGERFIISGPEIVTWATFFAAFAKVLGTEPPSFWTSERIVNYNQAATSRQLATLNPKLLLKNLVRRPYARQILEVCFERLPLRFRRRAINQLGSLGNRAHQTHVPDRRQLAFYRSTPIAGCEKARTQLGYNPTVDFQSGMSLTGSYLEWAYLRKH